MGKWESELNKVLKMSESDVKAFEEWTTHYQGIVDAAQAFVSGYAKAAPKLGKVNSTLMESAEDCGKAAAELSVYEDEYEEAKKNKNKDEMKQIEAKMKPLIEAFEQSKDRNRTAAKDGNKEGDALNELAAAISGAIG